MNMANKTKAAFALAFLARQTLRAIYSAKSHPITAFFPLIFRFSSRWTILFYLLLSAFTLFGRSCVIHRVQLHSLRGSFRSTFSYFYRSACTTSINHHSCILFSYIFTLDYNFGSFVSPPPSGLPFLSILFVIFFFPVADSLSLFFYNISLILSFSILAFIFSTVLITILIYIFHSNYSSPSERFHGIHIYLVNDAYLKKNGFSRFCIYILAVTFLLSLISCSLLSNQLYKLRSHTILSRFFPSDKRTRKSFLSFIRLKKVFFFSSFSLYHFSLLFRFITADSHVFLVRPLSVTLFFSFLLVAKQILRLSFHSFVFNRTMRRWISWFSSLLSVSLITVLRWGEIIYSRFSFATIGGI